MPAAVHSKLCSSVSAWLGILARIAMAMVIVFAGYLLLLCQLKAVFFDLIYVHIKK